MFSEKQWNKISNYIRSKITLEFDPSHLFQEDKNLRSELDVSHKGFYLSILDSEGNKVLKEGFLKESCMNVMDSMDIVLGNSIKKLKLDAVRLTKLQTSTFYFTVITDVIYISDPLRWDEKQDGIYFMWGGDYSSILLPFEIQKKSLSKIDTLDSLCSRANMPSSLWRLPEGLIWRLVAYSYSS